jgi:hypothetical protein
MSGVRYTRGNQTTMPVASEPEFGRGGTMKKIGFLTLLIMAMLVFTLAFSVAAATPKAPSAPVVAAVPVAPPAATPARHPHIDEALEHMRAAKHELEVAEHDFDGHRAKSLEHLNGAIHEAEICIGMP